jgi:hypothetical protein
MPEIVYQELFDSVICMDALEILKAANGEIWYFHILVRKAREHQA